MDILCGLQAAVKGHRPPCMLIPITIWKLRVLCMLMIVFVSLIGQFMSGVDLQVVASEPADNGVIEAEASANNQNQASVNLESSAEKGALDRQINPKGDPTPMPLPPEAQKAADAPPADVEGDDSPSSTAAQTTMEVAPPKDDKSTPAPGADEAALEGDDSPGGTADESAAEVTIPKDEESTPSPAPVEVGEGADSKEGADAGTGTIGASAPGGASDTPSPSGVELDKGVEEEALKRQVAPKGDPTPVELPPEAEKAAKVGKITAAWHTVLVHTSAYACLPHRSMHTTCTVCVCVCV